MVNFLFLTVNLCELLIYIVYYYEVAYLNSTFLAQRLSSHCQCLHTAEGFSVGMTLDFVSCAALAFSRRSLAHLYLLNSFLLPFTSTYFGWGFFEIYILITFLSSLPSLCTLTFTLLCSLSDSWHLFCTNFYCMHITICMCIYLFLYNSPHLFNVIHTHGFRAVGQRFSVPFTGEDHYFSSSQHLHLIKEYLYCLENN